MEQFLDHISDTVMKCKIVHNERTGKVDLLTVYANERVESLTGKSKEEVINKNLIDVFPELSDSIFDWPKIISEAAMTHDSTIIEQYIVSFDKYVGINVFGYKDGYIYIVITDLTERREIKRRLLERDREIRHLGEELKSMANEDMLTRLYNFQFVMESMKDSIESYNEDGTNFCVLIIDIDDFRKINQMYGTKAGDSTLQDVAKIIGSVARKIDVAGRYENDRFVIIFNNMDIEIAKLMVQKLKQEIEKRAMKLKDIQISFSGALLEYDRGSVEDFLDKLAIKIKKAKSLGTGTVIS